MTDSDMALVRDRIRSYEDFPKKGIIFRDIFAVYADKEGFRALMAVLRDAARKADACDVVVGLDARGAAELMAAAVTGLKTNSPGPKEFHESMRQLIGLLLATLTTLIANLAADLCYTWLDPRISYD